MRKTTTLAIAGLVLSAGLAGTAIASGDAQYEHGRKHSERYERHHDRHDYGRRHHRHRYENHHRHEHKREGYRHERWEHSRRGHRS